MTTMDDSGARAISGVTVVRDGHSPVRAPTERLVRKAAAAVKADWSIPTDLPTSSSVYEHLKKTGTAGGGRGTPTSRAMLRPLARRLRGRSTPVTGLVHRARAARTAIGGRRVDRRQADRLDGHAAASAFAPSCGSIQDSRNTSARDRAGHGAGPHGGKHSGEYAIEAARLAKRRVKLVWTRAEEFRFGYFRPAGVIDVKTAVDGDGRITAWEFDNWNSGPSAIQTPYDIPNGDSVLSVGTPLRQGSSRPGGDGESRAQMHMDAVARALGADAVEFRQHLKDERMRNVLTAVAQKIGWPKPSAAGRRRCARNRAAWRPPPSCPRLRKDSRSNV